MYKLITRKQYLFGLAMITAMICYGNALFWGSPYIGIPSFVLFFLSIIFFATRIFTRPNERYERHHFAAIALLCVISIIMTGVYYSYKITPTVSGVPLLGLLIIFFFKEKKSEHFSSYTHTKHAWVLFGLAVCADACLIAILFYRRSGDILVSPWQVLSPLYFLGYTLTTALLIWSNAIGKRPWPRYVSTSLHLFVGFSIAIILFIHGYGFDGFIHRATEEWIRMNGFILPKQLYYVGQYSLFVWLSNMSGVSIFYIDTLFVPLISALALPGIFSSTLRRVWHIPENVGVSLSLFVPFLYFITLNLTTPHNIVILLTITTICALLLYTRGELSIFFPFIYSIAALAVHPLLGAPLLLFSMCVALVYHTKKLFFVYAITAAACICVAFLPAVMFSLNNFLHGIPFPVFLNPFTRLDHFFELFARPYWYADKAPLVFELLYAWQRAIAPVAIALGICGFWLTRKKVYKTDSLFLLFFVSFIIGSLLLRTWIVFPDVADAEQTNYPMRLLWTSILFLIPWSAYALYILTKSLQNAVRSRPLIASFTNIGIVLSVSGILTLSLYLAYPQRNPKVYFPGYNVTNADIETVTQIHEKNLIYDYVVLSSQITAAAALSTYSFAEYYQTEFGDMFYYAIPSGGALANLYLQMLYEGQQREFMNASMTLTGTSHSYFVINKYWKNFEMIVEGAKKTADGWWAVQNEALYVFEYIL